MLWMIMSVGIVFVGCILKFGDGVWCVLCIQLFVLIDNVGVLFIVCCGCLCVWCGVVYV